MKAMAVRVLAAATALAVAVPTGASAAARHAHPQPLQAALDGLVAAGAPGAVLLDRHGARTTRLASGYADVVEGRAMRAGGRVPYTPAPGGREPYLAGDLGHVWTPQQLLDIAFEHEPLFAPGTAFNYS